MTESRLFWLYGADSFNCIKQWALLFPLLWSEVKVTQLCPTLCDPHGLYSTWNSPGQNTGVGSSSLLQGIFPAQGLNPGLLHCRQILLFFFSFIFISWRLITLQYCSGFCHTLTWISHGFTCVPHPDPPSSLPLHPIPLGVPSAPAPSTCLMHPTWAGDLFCRQILYQLSHQGSLYIMDMYINKKGLSQSYLGLSAASWETCMQVRKQQLELDMEHQTGSK